MTKFIAIISGKGGVGKTTAAINIGTALSGFGRDIIVVDANLRTPNLHLHLGTPNLPYTLKDALKGRKHITEVAYMHPSGLKVIPSTIDVEEVDTLDPARLADILLDLEKTCEAVFLDTRTGIGNEAKQIIKASDEAIVITNPDLPSVHDTEKVIRVTEDLGVKVIGIVVNRFRNDPFDISIDNIRSILGKPIIGIIPEDITIRKATSVKHPVVYTHPDSESAIAYKKIAAKLIGEEYKHDLEKEEKKKPLHHMLKKLGLKEMEKHA